MSIKTKAEAFIVRRTEIIIQIWQLVKIGCWWVVEIEWESNELGKCAMVPSSAASTNILTEVKGHNRTLTEEAKKKKERVTEQEVGQE